MYLPHYHSVGAFALASASSAQASSLKKYFITPPTRPCTNKNLYSFSIRFTSRCSSRFKNQNDKPTPSMAPNNAPKNAIQIAGIEILIIYHTAYLFSLVSKYHIQLRLSIKRSLKYPSLKLIKYQLTKLLALYYILYSFKTKSHYFSITTA